MAYTTPLTGESDYDRAMRAYNSYVSSGNKQAQKDAEDYIRLKGWGSAIPVPKAITPSGSPVENETAAANREENNYYYGNPGGTGSMIRSTGTYNPARVITPTVYTPAATDNENSDIWQKFMTWATPYMQRPTTAVPTYESISDQIAAQMQPLHAQQELQLQQSQDEAIKGLAANLANRGMYNSDVNEKKAAEVYNKGNNAKALADAAFESDIGTKAQNIYRNEKSAATAADQQYNQSMINLGLAMMNGMIDMNKFLSDDAYRNAQLAALFGNTVLSQFGAVK